MKFRKTVKKILKSIAALAVVIVLLVVYFKTNTTVSSDFTIASATENSFFLTAHRGLSSVAPENSAPHLKKRVRQAIMPLNSISSPPKTVCGC